MTNPFRHLATFHCLARNLDTLTLVTCLRICRAWFHVLEPYLWRDFRLLRQSIPPEYQTVLHRNRRLLSYNSTGSGLALHGQQQQQLRQQQRRQPSVAAIQRNGRHIRRLFYFGEEQLFHQLMPYCTQLIYFETARYELGMKPLLLQNQDTLHTVIFKADPVQNAELISIEWIWKYLADAPNLRVLELSSVIVSDYEGSKFGLVCRNLTHLSLINAKLIERPKSETGDHFVNLKSLVLDQTYFPRIEQLELLQLCPNLELLTWKSRTGSFPLANFFSYLRLDHQQHLAQLTKLDLSTSKIQDESFAQVIELIPQLTRLHVAKTLFGSIATRVLLQGRGPHMQVINVLDCSDVTKVESQALLMGCPALKEFYAPVVSALGMLGSKWVCTGLEVLDICIADIDQLPSPSYPRHRAVYTQLSVLAKLQVLRLGDLGFASVPDRRIAIVPGYIEPRSASPQDRQQQNHQLKYVLDMRLESGLGLLSTLTKLRELNVVKLHAAMEFADLQWIVQNWRRLRVVVGSVHPQEQQRDLSNDFLREFIPGLHTFLNTQEQKMWGQLESMK